MKSFDLEPLWRSTIGFDRLFDLIDDPETWSGESNYLGRKTAEAFAGRGLPQYGGSNGETLEKGSYA